MIAKTIRKPHAFKSKFEEDVSSLYNLKDVYEIESVEYSLLNRYTPDFKLTDNTYLECKGFFKPSDRRKMLEVKAQHPDLSFIMFFQNSGVKLTKKSKTSYGDWCTKHDIQWFCWKHKKPTARVLNLAARNAPVKPD
jgi:hypothetical protein